MNFFGIGQSADIDIVFDGADARKMAEVKTEDGKKEKYLLYYDGETVSGRVNVTLKKPGSKLEHQGIRIDLIGQIELYYDRGNHHEFQSLVKELARPGDLIQNTNYPFEFANVEKPYEVYVGSNVRLRYFLRVTITRRISDIVREIDVAVHTLCSYPEMNSPIKMEVGIEDCLHIEFEYNKSKYHLKDVIVGKIYFLLVRIKIKHMEIAIIKRETTGSGPNTYTENETIAKYEIMDGAPVKGESIPIRVFLAGYDLTPTMRDINKKFSVRYFLNLVLMDTEDRRYFKQQEITLWRKADKGRKSTLNSTNPHVPSHLVGSDGEIMSSADIMSTVRAQAAAAGRTHYPKGMMRQPLGGNDGDDDDGDNDDEEDDEEDDAIDERRLPSAAVDRRTAGAPSSALLEPTSPPDLPTSSTMGMFTQESSPIQESRPLPTDTSSSSLAEEAASATSTTAAATTPPATTPRPSPSSSATVAVSASSPQHQMFTADVQSMRGAGDGAPQTGGADATAVSEQLPVAVDVEASATITNIPAQPAATIATAAPVEDVVPSAAPPASSSSNSNIVTATTSATSSVEAAIAVAPAKPAIGVKPTSATTSTLERQHTTTTSYDVDDPDDA